MPHALKLSIIAVIIAAVAAIVFFRTVEKSEDSSTPVGQVPESASSGLRAGSNAIYVPEQSPGKTVTVGFVVLARAGFVVIHENAEDVPGKILGESALLEAGEHATIESIPLSQEVKDGEELFAVLHQDDGDGFFDAAMDLPVSDEAGNTIMMSFFVSADAEPPMDVSL